MLECGSIKADVKNCSPVSACATLLKRNAEHTHILSHSLHTHTHNTEGGGKKIMDLHNEVGTAHWAIGCVQTQEFHGNTGIAGSHGAGIRVKVGEESGVKCFFCCCCCCHMAPGCRPGITVCFSVWEDDLVDLNYFQNCSDWGAASCQFVVCLSAFW